MSKQEVILCKELENDLTHAIGKCPHDKLFILLKNGGGATTKETYLSNHDSKTVNLLETQTWPLSKYEGNGVI